MNIDPAFFKVVDEIIPEKERSEFWEALKRPSVTGIKKNLKKACPPIWVGSTTPIPWNAGGLILHERPNFTLDPLFHAGTYYVQDPSAMFVEYIVQQLRSGLPEDPVLGDLCAAPGGKSTGLLNAMGGKGLLLANELISRRFQVLRENLIKWGCDNVVLSNQPIERFKNLPPIFDILLLDVPCSGEGMFRKSEAARKAWSTGLVEMNADRQKKLVSDAIHTAKPGGVIIYCTCTLNRQENEEVIDYIRQNTSIESVKIDFPSHWNLLENEENGFQFIRFLPHRVSGEGMTWTCFKLTENDHFPNGKTRRTDLQPLQERESTNLNKLLDPGLLSEGKLSQSPKGEVFFTRKSYASLIDRISTRLKCRPLPLGQLRKQLFTPNHFSAMAGFQNPDVPVLELSLDQSRAYLRREIFSIPQTVRSGYSAVSYRQTILGWVKIHSDLKKWTNLYPTSHRIKN